MFQKILVALDNTEQNQAVFEKAVDLAKTNQASLLLLHVTSPPDELYPMSPMGTFYAGFDRVYPVPHEELIRSAFHSDSMLEKIGETMLRSRVQAAQAANIVVESAQRIGDPGTLICDLAKSWNADLIVLGRRGRSGLTELLLGSVSNHVMHHAPCSVLVVQPALVPA